MAKALAIKVPKELTLKDMVKIETQNREILTAFITDHMKSGVDYGKIHINSQCQNKYECKNSYHFSKDCLFKPGSEKFASLMKLVPRFRKDAETWEMAGSKNGLICFVCELTNSKGDIVGEGRGAADITEKNWSMNNVIKIAQKRAQIDAVLRTGGLSDFFTQDLEDMAPSEKKTSIAAPTNPPLAVETPAEQKEREFKFSASVKQVNYIKVLLKQKGFSEEELFNDYQITNLDQLTLDQASQVIGDLQAMPMSEGWDGTEARKPND